MHAQHLAVDAPPLAKPKDLAVAALLSRDDVNLPNFVKLAVGLLPVSYAAAVLHVSKVRDIMPDFLNFSGDSNKYSLTELPYVNNVQPSKV